MRAAEIIGADNTTYATALLLFLRPYPQPLMEMDLDMAVWPFCRAGQTNCVPWEPILISAVQKRGCGN
jgi:hypothetical protein